MKKQGRIAKLTVNEIVCAMHAHWAEIITYSVGKMVFRFFLVATP